MFLEGVAKKLPRVHHVLRRLSPRVCIELKSIAASELATKAFHSKIPNKGIFFYQQRVRPDASEYGCQKREISLTINMTKRL